MKKWIAVAVSIAFLAMGMGWLFQVAAQDINPWSGYMYFKQLNPEMRFQGTLKFATLGGVTAATLTDAGAFSPAGSVTASGVADGFVFLPAMNNCSMDNTTTSMVPTRVAASNWALARTAAGAETYNINCSLNNWLQRTTTTKGVQIDSLRIAHQITVAALTTSTWGKVATRTFANNAAITIGSDLATTPTLPTATQTNPYYTSVAIATPATIPIAADVDLNVEYQVVMANSGVYRLYGVGVNFHRIDY